MVEDRGFAPVFPSHQIVQENGIWAGQEQPQMAVAKSSTMSWNHNEIDTFICIFCGPIPNYLAVQPSLAACGRQSWLGAGQELYFYGKRQGLRPCLS